MKRFLIPTFVVALGSTMTAAPQATTKKPPASTTTVAHNDKAPSHKEGVKDKTKTKRNKKDKKETQDTHK